MTISVKLNNVPCLGHSFECAAAADTLEALVKHLREIITRPELRFGDWRVPTTCTVRVMLVSFMNGADLGMLHRPSR